MLVWPDPGSHLVVCIVVSTSRYQSVLCSQKTPVYHGYVCTCMDHFAGMFAYAITNEHFRNGVVYQALPPLTML